VNAALILATLRQRLASPSRLILLLLLGGTPLFVVLVSPRSGFAGLGDCYFLGLVFAAGMIGQDLSSGTLPLLLARPVTRAQYVASRWIAAAAGTFAVVTLQVLLAALIMLLRGVPLPWDEAALYLGTNALLALGVTAVMALLSSLAAGLGDLWLLFLVFFSAQVLEKVGQFKSWGWLVRGAEELLRTLRPEFSLTALAGGGPFPWLALVTYLSTVTLCLALAIVVVNRRELSYATSN